MTEHDAAQDHDGGAPEWTAETARWYADKYGDWPTQRVTVDAIASRIGDGATVVDIGCGTGEALRVAATRTEASRLIGIDPVPAMIEIARAQTKAHAAAARIEFAVAPARALPLEDGSADVVMAINSLFHWRDQAAGLAEAARVLGPRGLLLVAIDHEIYETDGQSADRVRTAIRDAGFAVTETRALREGPVAFDLFEAQPRA